MVHDTRAVDPGRAVLLRARARTSTATTWRRRPRRRAPPRSSWSARVDSPLPQLLARSVRDAMGPIADAFWGHPSEALTVVGVTGTSGKTTTTHLLALDLRGARLVVRRCSGTLSGPAHHPRGARAAGAPGRASATPGGRPSRWRCRRTRSPWAGRGDPLRGGGVHEPQPRPPRLPPRPRGLLRGEGHPVHRPLHRRRRREPRRPPRRRAGAPRDACPPTATRSTDADDLVVGTTSCSLPLARPAGRRCRSAGAST